ncbi:putative cell wall protein [Cryphonectria parasitica EP155]|uniref:Cell wall protein n=1 Tax=Cryphonectria parasitica (strain ATCC 38755 / EP155) TaxID=660469 RepID=A0A9P4XYT1_CRYP1|nr:putative cell wall protein [Cryphonectria parasitica EP155]KAF3763394.1 putative cell wall protein [Cryphonectria parasitica EP155]
MQSNMLALLSLVGAAAAAPQVKVRDTIAVGDAFGLTALRSGSPVHLQSFQAANNTFFVGLTAQGAECDTESNFATFFLGEDASLNLYSTSAPYQQAFVDASGMGQGIIGYTTGAQPAPGSQTGFALDAYNDLTYNNLSFIACPWLNGAYTIWVDAGVANPAGNLNCTGISVRATKAETPDSCLYTAL